MREMKVFEMFATNALQKGKQSLFFHCKRKRPQSYIFCSRPQDHCHRMALFLPVLLLSVSVYSVKSEQRWMARQSNCKMRVFRLLYPDGRALQSNVIAQTAAENVMDCGYPCITDSNCKAFNFKAKRSDMELNCQLTNNHVHNFEEKSERGSTGWLFYQHDLEDQISDANASKPVIPNTSVVQSNVTQFGLVLNSTILFGEPGSFIRELESWLPKKANWTACWRGSRDGWSAAVFHAGCDDKGPTLVIVRVDAYIFGGYTEASWKAHPITGIEYKSAPESFIFSLRNKDSIAPFKAALQHEDDDTAIGALDDAGPTFGFFHDLKISENANSNNYSVTNFGRSYQAPPGYGYLRPETVTLLAGTQYFSPSEVEVFYLH